MIFGILEMPEGRRQCQALTQSDVLHFVGWLPYCTREKFDKYRTEHPDLEPFLPYDFAARGHTSEKEHEDGGGVPRGHSPYISDLGKFLLISNTFHFFAGMATDAEKEHYKNLLGKDREGEGPAKEITCCSFLQQASQPTGPF